FNDIDTLEKLRFILNRKIIAVPGTKDEVNDAINNGYGQIEGEYADSMLQEFADTAIDFTETSAEPQFEGVDEFSAPVVRLVNLLIQEALQLRSSHILVQNCGDHLRF